MNLGRTSLSQRDGSTGIRFERARQNSQRVSSKRQTSQESQQLSAIHRSINEVERGIQQDFNAINNRMFYTRLAHSNYRQFEDEIQELSSVRAASLNKELKAQQKQNLKQKLLSICVVNEYKEGMSDPQRPAAQFEKEQNKKLRV